MSFNAIILSMRKCHRQHSILIDMLQDKNILILLLILLIVALDKSMKINVDNCCSMKI